MLITSAQKEQGKEKGDKRDDEIQILYNSSGQGPNFLLTRTKAKLGERGFLPRRSWIFPVGGIQEETPVTRFLRASLCHILLAQLSLPGL